MTDLLHNTFLYVVLTVAVAVVVQRLSRGLIARLVRHRSSRRQKRASPAEEKKREDTLTGIFDTASTVVIVLITVLIILWQLDVNIAALLTGAGLVGVLVGFGAQSTVRDYLAGIFIIAENQYRVGDVVTLHAGSEVSGVVEDISIRITRLRDMDGNLHIVRNGEATVVTNRSIRFANVNIDVNVSYDTDIDKAEAIINEVGLAITGSEKWKGDIIEAIRFLRVDSFNEYSVTLKVLGKVKPGSQWAVAGEFRRRIKVAFEKGGIDMPLPQMLIHQVKAK